MPPGAQTELGLLEATLRIRAFETAANQRYLSAKMPGLTHLSVGEEADASSTRSRASSKSQPAIVR
jgi:TPP-dependent pyruvate/acetoin dehydrogenase alpha subunit